MRLQLFYRYSVLDKQHQYQVVGSETIWTQWVWFHMGRLIPKNAKYSLYPYEMSFVDNNQLLKEYDGNSARIVAGWIVNRINKDYLRRVEKEVI